MSDFHLTFYLFVSAFEQGERPTPKLTKFVSGDELDDDFMTENSNVIQQEKPSDSKDTQAKSKKKQGHKVVNFPG